jgi:hypothetical protein
LDFLDRTLYHNSVRAWLIAAAAFALVFAILVLARRLLTRRFAGAAARTSNTFDDLALELARRGGGIGVAALCGGGGQGDALVVRVPAR